MNGINEGRVSLRRASEAEMEILRARAVRQCKAFRKKFMPIAVFGVIAPVVLFIFNLERFHKPFYTYLSIGAFIFAVVAFGLYLYLGGRGYSKRVNKGEFKVQRGQIVDKRASEFRPEVARPKIVFESDDGIRSVITIENDNYSEIDEAPCIIIKWDYYGDDETYEVAMLNKER